MLTSALSMTSLVSYWGNMKLERTLQHSVQRGIHKTQFVD